MNSTVFYSHLTQLLMKGQVHSRIKTLWVAFSGGMDSHVLLHLLSKYTQSISRAGKENNTRAAEFIRPLQKLAAAREFEGGSEHGTGAYKDINLKAIHIHHGLSPKADAWAAHCQEICQSLKIPLTIQKITLPTPHYNIEAVAREKRYTVFSQLLEENAVLLTAHHQHDQAETFLLQLFRGSGLKGLASMPEKMTLGPGWLIRPLLSFSKPILQQYAKEHSLNWIEDESNQQMRFHRNFLRNRLFPFLQTRWPSIHRTLSRSANHLAEAEILLEELAKEDLKESLLPNQNLLISKLLPLSEHRLTNALRHWLIQLKLPLPSHRKLLAVKKTVLNCKPDSTPLVTWQEVEIRKYRNQLYAIRKNNENPMGIKDKSMTYQWDLQSDLNIQSIQQVLSKEKLMAQGIDLSDITYLTVRFRQGGERYALKGCTKSLKKLFQEWGIPPWERDKIPLIYKGNQIIAIWK